MEPYLQNSVMSLALVIDDNDPKKLSRVKVRLLPGMKDISEADLPWAEPINYLLGHGDSTGEHRPPEIGTQIFVIVTKRGTNFYYTHDAYVEGFAVYEQFPSVSQIGTQTYPQPRFKLYKDGSVHFINTDTGEQGFVTSTGTTVVVDSSGAVIVDNGSGDFELKSSGQFSVNGNFTVDP